MIQHSSEYPNQSDGVHHRFIAGGDDEVRQLYEQYQAAESDAEYREIALKMAISMGADTKRFTPHSRTSNNSWGIELRLAEIVRKDVP